MLIKRQVFERMAEAYPELVFDYAYTNDEHEGNVAFFDTYIDPETKNICPRTMRSAGAGPASAARSMPTSTACSPTWGPTTTRAISRPF
jgi:hypothetical protein